MIDIKVCAHTKPRDIQAIKKLAKNSGLFDGKKVESITYMPGGLTNRNFKVYINDKKWAFRIAGEGTAEYLNRPCEKAAVAAVNHLGISPEFYYYDEETGSNIRRFVEGDAMSKEDFRKRSEVRKHAAEILRTYHNSGITFDSIFDPFAEVDSYHKYLEENNWTKFYPEMEQLDLVYEKIKKAFKKNPPPLISSHNDCLSENFLFDAKKDKMELIDWEYCGMNFYSFDVAAVISENEMNEEQEEDFMQYYFQGEPTLRQRAETLMGKFIMDGLWIPWALVQSVTKVDEREDYWDWGYVRVNRCMRHVANPHFDEYLKIIANPV
ncbi:MAG: choline/ethanolamine kinase family protein [Clostridiales bacterium]